MKLSPRELEGLLIHQTGYLAQKRLSRGVKLNHPEAVALIASQVSCVIVSQCIQLSDNFQIYNDFLELF